MDEGQLELLKWFEAARSGDLTELERMLEEGIWAEAPSPLDGMTALMTACAEGREEAARLLASQSEIDARDEWGNTAAIVAAAAGHRPIVRMLLDMGADPQVRNQAGLDVEAALCRFEMRSRCSG